MIVFSARSHPGVGYAIRRLLSACLLALTVVGGCASMGVSSVEDNRPWTESEREILASTQSSADAWNRGDLVGHLAIYVDTVTFMTENGPRPGVRAVEEAFRATYFQGGQPRQNLRFESVTVRRLAPGAALQTGRFVLSGGNLAEQSGWFTLVWVLTDDGWRAVHDHTS